MIIENRKTRSSRTFYLKTSISKSCIALLFVVLICVTLCSCNVKEEKRLCKEGEKSLENGYLTKATEFFTKAIEANSSYAKAYFLRGKAHFQLRDYQKATDDITKGFSLDSRDKRGEWTHLRGCAYRELRDHERSLSDFNAAIEKGNKYLRSYELNSNPAFDAKRNYERQLQGYYQDRDNALKSLQGKPK